MVLEVGSVSVVRPQHKMGLSLQESAPASDPHWRVEFFANSESDSDVVSPDDVEDADATMMSDTSSEPCNLWGLDSLLEDDSALQHRDTSLMTAWERDEEQYLDSSSQSSSQVSCASGLFFALPPTEEQVFVHHSSTSSRPALSPTRRMSEELMWGGIVTSDSDVLMPSSTPKGSSTAPLPLTHHATLVFNPMYSHTDNRLTCVTFRPG